LYCSYPPQPDLPRAYHLLPSAAAAAKKARLAAAQSRNESTECASPRAGEEAGEGPRPAAAVATKTTRPATVRGSGESSECVDSPASEGTEGGARRESSSDQSLELAGALPPVPKGQRQMRKRKAEEVESSRYGVAVLASYQVPMMPNTNSTPLQSSCSTTRI
jgi:hypothetical protein